MQVFVSPGFVTGNHSFRKIKIYGVIHILFYLSRYIAFNFNLFLLKGGESKGDVKFKGVALDSIVQTTSADLRCMVLQPISTMDRQRSDNRCVSFVTKKAKQY